ncbi:putative basic helix-loop-helix protein [Spatholobus suberectus]|nr:putative basic helix-loop-helix protein [Spatholobus suberectus]
MGRLKEGTADYAMVSMIARINGGDSPREKARWNSVPTEGKLEALAGGVVGIRGVSDGCGSSDTANSWTAIKTASRVAEEAGWKRVLQRELGEGECVVLEGFCCFLEE